VLKVAAWPWLFLRVSTSLLTAGNTSLFFGIHLRIVMYVAHIGKALCLSFSCHNDPLAYVITGLCQWRLCQLFKRDGLHFYMQINTIQQRPLYFTQIALHFRSGMTRTTLVVMKITWGCGIHTCHQHKRRRTGKCKLSSGNGNLSVF